MKNHWEYDETQMTVGTHTLRKTGFLFAVFGTLTSYNMTGRRSITQPMLQPMDDSAIRLAARHDKTTDPYMYYQDCMTRFVEFQMDPHLAEENRVSPWQPNYVQYGNTRKTLTVDNRYDKLMDTLANEYVEKELNIDKKRVHDVTYEQLIGLACRPKRSYQTIRERYDQITGPEHGNLREALKEEIWSVLEDGYQEYRLHFAGAGMCPAAITDTDDGTGKFCFYFLFFFLNLFFAHRDPVAHESHIQRSCTGNSNEQKRNHESTEKVEEVVKPNKKVKKRKYGSVNYDDKKGLLKAAITDRRRTFQFGLEFAKLSITSTGEHAVDSPTSSWVSKLRSAVAKWKKCIDTCWKDRGGEEGFLAMDGTLAYANYQCRCPKN